jgi:CRISPR/Cas system-associated exonuclease Cas4 (RecB family)
MSDEATPPFLSGSGLARAEACPAAYALDADRERAHDERSDASRGTAIHAYCERLSRGVARAKALALCPREVLETCAGINPAAIPAGEPEIAFSLNVATGESRRLERVAHRSYGELLPTEIPGTLDLIVRPENNHGLALVIDFKTGVESVPAARGCLQLEFGAICVANDFGVDEVEIQIARIDEEGAIHFDAHVMDAFALEAARARIARVFARVTEARAARLAGEESKVRESRYCKYCPTKGHCPAYGREAMALATRSEGWLEGLRADLASNDGAAHWYERYKKAAWIVDELKKELDARILAGDIVLPDGRRVRRVPEARRRIDGKRALPLLREKFGEEVAEAAADVKITLTSIRSAFGEDADGVEALLDQEGLITAPTVMTTRVLRR